MPEVDSAPEQRPVSLPDGSTITDNGPIVIVGPNGSGKSRRSRELTSTVIPEVISAMRNTRMSPQLQPMALQDARTNFINQRNTARNQPYELTNDFDFMLTALIGDALETSLEYLRKARVGEAQDLPELVVLEKIQVLWGRLFPGRELRFEEYRPIVINTVAVGDEPQQYSAWQMSDGEKAALYLAGRVLASEPSSVILVDEPETHFHSLLAVQFWDALERERPDVRFIYATHDMTFAASRDATQYLLANPKDGLSTISLSDGASDLAAVLLGTASLSFYASKILFCEGEADALDAQLYAAWFDSKEIVVQPVGACDMVMRSVSALSSSQLVQNLTVLGVIDRDFHSDDRLDTLPQGVQALSVHEVETLYVLPSVVGAVAKHLGVSFDEAQYTREIRDKYTDSDRHRVVLERWKVRVERSLALIVSDVSTKQQSLDDIAKAIPDLFESANWNFSPADILAEEKERVEQLFTGSANLDEILAVMPGKQLRPLGPAAVGVKPNVYDSLIVNAVRGDDAALQTLGKELRGALNAYMPSV